MTVRDLILAMRGSDNVHEVLEKLAVSSKWIADRIAGGVAARNASTGALHSMGEAMGAPGEALRRAAQENAYRGGEKATRAVDALRARTEAAQEALARGSGSTPGRLAARANTAKYEAGHLQRAVQESDRLRMPGTGDTAPGGLRGAIESASARAGVAAHGPSPLAVPDVRGNPLSTPRPRAVVPRPFGGPGTPRIKMPQVNVHEALAAK